MEHDPSRRQYAPTSYAPQQQQQQQQQSQQQQQQPQATGYSSQYAAAGARFRPSSYISQSPTTATPSGRPGADTAPFYSFQQGAQYPSAPSIQQSPVQYTQDMHASEAQRQQSQQFSQYQGEIMYGIQQPQAPQTPQSAYDTQYRQRANPASETLAAPFGVPQTAQYYLAAGQAGPTSAAGPEFPAQPLPSQYQTHESYAQPPGPSASQVYASAMMDPSSSSSYQTFGQQPQYTQQQAQSSDQAFEEYQRSIRQIATLTNDGTLRDADQYLLHISQYLLGNAERLQLSRDDETLHDDRIRLWDEFNRTWLTALQRQHDLTESSIQQRGLREPQSIMSAQTLERLAQELIKLCDNVERHGLVDYQMGVAEEEIVDLLIQCLHLLDPNDERTSEIASAAGAMRNR